MTAGLLGVSLAGSRPSRAQGFSGLHTDGSQIVDSKGNPVILTGISWFGLETESFAPHGLWARNWESILDQIVTLGFNTIRLPYSNQLLEPGSLPNSINYEINPDLKGMTGLEIMDKLIQGAGKRGLKVILDRHRPDSHAQSELWYTPAYSEERWIQDWVMLAQRYGGDGTVIGADLHNEPHGQATWGSGDPATDWRLAAEKAGNAILAVDPGWLIIVEGVERYQDDWYWWGGNLIGAGEFPVQLDQPHQLVYSTHVYGPGVYPQPWFSDPSFPDNLAGIWDRHWGYLNQEGIAPVILGEFGGRSVGDDPEGVWQRTLVSYLRANNISYMYWTINPDSGDTGGLLLDDWQSIDPAKQALLSGYQFSIIGIEQAGPQSTQPAGQPTQAAPSQATLAATPTPAPTVPVQASLDVRYRSANPADQSSDTKPEFIIANLGGDPVPLERVSLSYWLRDELGQPLVYHCDWAQVGCANILGDFQTSPGGDQYLRLRFSERAGEIAPGGDTGEIKIRFNRQDWSTFPQAAQYSYAAVTEYTDWPKVTLYLDGALVWGVEPGGQSAQAAAQPQATPTAPNPTLAPTFTAMPAPSAAPTLPYPGLPLSLQPAGESTYPPADPGSAQSPSLSLLLVGLLAGFFLGLLTLRIGRARRSSGRDERPKGG